MNNSSTSTPRSNIPVVELVRVSTDTQAAADKAGIPAQREANKQTCQRYKLRVVKTVELIDVSGADVFQTPEMKEIIQLIEAGKIHGIVTAEYSRLLRSDKWSDLALLQVFAEYNVQVFLPSGPIDFCSEAGFTQASVFNLVSALERRRIAERMRRGKEEKRKRGEHVAGGIGLPLGLTYSKDKGWEYTPEIETVREAFQRFLAGERNLAELGRKLGIKRKTLRVILQNEAYTGWRVYKTKRDLSPQGKYQTQDGRRGHRRKIPREPEEIIRVRLPLEPIVSEVDFATVQKLLEETRTRVLRNRKDRSELFTYRGFLFCGHPECGLVLYGTQKTSKTGKHTPGRRFYFCKSLHPYRQPKDGWRCSNKHMVSGKVDEAVDNAIQEKLTTPTLMLEALEAYNESVTAGWQRNQGDRGSIEKKVSRLEARRERVLESFYDGVVSKEERDEKLVAVSGELDSLRTALNDAESKPPTLDPETVVSLLSTFHEWQFLEAMQKRRILEALMPAIFVYRYQIQGILFPTSRLGSEVVTRTAHLRAAAAILPTRACETREVRRGITRQHVRDSPPQGGGAIHPRSSRRR